MEINLLNLFWLFFAHFLGDFALQPSWMGKIKREDPYTMIGHCFIWTGIISIFLNFIGLLSLWKILFLFFGHLIMDYLKLFFLRRYPPFLKNSIDQLFHIFQTLIVYFF